TERREALDTNAFQRDETTTTQVRRIPAPPIRAFGLERRVPRGDALDVDRTHMFPVARQHLFDHNRHTIFVPPPARLFSRATLIKPSKIHNTFALTNVSAACSMAHTFAKANMNCKGETRWKARLFVL